MLSKIIAYGIMSSLLLLLLACSSYFLNDAWIEWKLSEKLTQEGILTQAVVQRCTRTRENCSTTYQYEVPSSDQQIQTVTVREYGCNCRKGEQVMILYLPNNPSQARLYAGQHFISLMKGILCMMWIIGLIIFFFFPDFLESRVKILID